MTLVGYVKDNWRLLLLTVLLLASLYFLFVPSAPITGAAADGVPDANTSVGGDGLLDTNLQFGIDLAGGARITAPLHGYHVEDVGVDANNTDRVVSELAASMNVSESNVVTSARRGSQDDDFVEVRAAGNRSAFVAGLQAAGLDVDRSDVQPGVRDGTRDQVVEVLDRRLGESGFSGGSVTQLRDRSPPQVRVEAPGMELEQLETRVQERGDVGVYAHLPEESPAVENGTERVRLFGQDGLQGEPSPVDTGEGGASITVTLTESAADHMTDVMQETGFAEMGGEACGPEDEPQPGEWCMLTIVDDEIVFKGSLDDTPPSNSLAESFRTGTFREERQFRLTTGGNQSQANELRLNIIAGALPTPVNVEESSGQYVSASYADDFRINSLIVGIVAVIAVVLTVFARYGDPKVAAPMSATALSEVVILLGFAAAIGWPLELSHVAGFVAVIGTGVDDLIIIADEIKQQGQVSSQRVFQNRFRKAFWVIGAAAATTIVAMSPLAILNLGDLRGFAIITILGVLIGIAVTRPAYGSILRRLTTGEH